MEYRTAYPCIPPSYVKQAKCLWGRPDEGLHSYQVSQRIPDGAEVKVFETEDAVRRNGADKVDMVISNPGALKDSDYETMKSRLRL